MVKTQTYRSETILVTGHATANTHKTTYHNLGTDKFTVIFQPIAAQATTVDETFTGLPSVVSQTSTTFVWKVVDQSLAYKAKLIED